MSTEKYIRITSLIPRKKGTTPEAFHKHWATVHGPLVLDFMMRHGVVEYRQVRPCWNFLNLRSQRSDTSQYHTTPETKAIAEAIAKAAGRTVVEFDGISDVYVKDIKTWQAAFTGPEYVDVIKPDELNFIDVENLQTTIGYDYFVVEDGKPVIEHARSF